MQKPLLVLFLVIIIIAHVLSLGKASDAMKKLPQGEDDTFTLPSSIVKIASLEFQGLTSDVLFLKSIIFLGSTLDRKERPRVKEWEWKWLTDVLDTITDLDPYFFDPYFFANSFLTWDAGKVAEADRLLEKGSHYRDWDWTIPFYIGFNEFFFLHNDSRAADFLMEASRRPEGSPFLASIASRLAFKEHRTETAILFLEEIYNKSDDKILKSLYKSRLEALQSIDNLEKAVSFFKNKFGRTPVNIEELVSKNVVSQLPRDPYGGNYFIDKEGKIRSTTSSELEPYLSPLQKKLQQ